jgi:hypothetical protein
MIAPMNDQLQDTGQPAPADDHGRGRRYQACRERAVNAFLREVLTKGPVAVIELEQRARKVRLLGGRQRITDAKVFKRAKKLLGVQSKRGGFGRGGEWFWELSIRSSTLVADTTANTAPKTQVSVAYVEDHSRPEPCSSRGPTVRSTSDSPPTEKTRSHRFPLEWEKGVERFITDGSMPASPIIAGTFSSMTAPSFSIRTTVGQAAPPNLVGTLWRCLAATRTGH